MWRLQGGHVDNEVTNVQAGIPLQASVEATEQRLTGANQLQVIHSRAFPQPPSIPVPLFHRVFLRWLQMLVCWPLIFLS